MSALPRRLLRLEGPAVLAGVLAPYFQLGLAPDVSIVGKRA